MELRPKTCISLPFLSSYEGTPVLNRGTLPCSGKQTCLSTWKQAPPWASHKIWHVGQPRLEPQAGPGPQPSSPGWPAASCESLREPGRPPQEENNHPVTRAGVSAQGLVKLGIPCHPFKPGLSLGQQEGAAGRESWNSVCGPHLSFLTSASPSALPEGRTRKGRNKEIRTVPGGFQENWVEPITLSSAFW